MDSHNLAELLRHASLSAVYHRRQLLAVNVLPFGYRRGVAVSHWSNHGRADGHECATCCIMA